MKKKLSIIIPVYNVEKYIARCIDSILNQDLTHCEIIIIDDGSTDKSGEICEKYKVKNQKLKVIHKENGGLSDARNCGIENSKGEYLWFIDSDDFIEEKTLEKIYDIITKYSTDVIVCNSKTIDEYGKTKDECQYTIPKGLYTRDEYLKVLTKNPKSVLFCAQYHICKRELLLKNKTFFYKDIIHEDELWTPQILLKASNIYYSNLNIYYHYMRSDSIMHASKIEKSGKCDLFVSKELIKIFNNINNINDKYLRDRAANIFLQSVWKVPNLLSNSKSERVLAYKNAYYFKTKLKAILYMVSPKLYLKIHKIFK